MSTKKKILELLKSVERPGMGRLIEEICDSTYFQASCHQPQPTMERNTKG